MKKIYTHPQAIEELFMPNSYVAACQYNKNSTFDKAGMQCANPYHDDYKNDVYFSHVWVDGINSCTTKLTGESIQTAGDAFAPNAGATVYYLGSYTAQCTKTYKNNGTTYNVPEGYNTNGHYGSVKVDSATTQNIINNVNS